MKRAPLLVVAALLACSAGDSTELPSASADDFHVRIPFQKYGFPGPWWREDATQVDFEESLAHCRRESTAARKARSNDEDEKDVAYRAFLECMQGEGWTRGLPPVEERAG